VLPAAVFILVRLNFVPIAAAVVVLSKWRMFAVRPRFWAANIRANSVDLMVGLSIVAFMDHSGSALVQFVWAALYTVWLLVVKPRSTLPWVTAQAFIGQLCALMALYLIWPEGPVFALTLLTGFFCFLAARHFLDIFDEPYARMLAYIWGYFGAALAWLLSHMLITYPNVDNGIVAQPVLFLSVIGYGLGILYYFDHFDKLSRFAKRQTVGIIILMALALIISLFLRTRHLVA
jgi:hypothetical protein